MWKILHLKAKMIRWSKARKHSEEYGTVALSTLGSATVFSITCSRFLRDKPVFNSKL